MIYWTAVLGMLAGLVLGFTGNVAESTNCFALAAFFIGYACYERLAAPRGGKGGA